MPVTDVLTGKQSAAAALAQAHLELRQLQQIVRDLERADTPGATQAGMDVENACKSLQLAVEALSTPLVPR